MELKRYKNILAIKSDSEEFIGFHCQNLELAELDMAAWQAISSPESDPATIQELDSWNMEVSEDARNLKHPDRVLSLSLNIAQVCNLKCTYCAAGGDGTYGGGPAKVDVTAATEQIKFFLDKLEPGDDFYLRFFGGEPLLYPGAIKEIFRFCELYLAGKDNQVKYSITTNGTLITPKVAELLGEMKANVMVSIDGSPDVNDVTRPTNSKVSSSLLTTRGIEELLKVKDQLGTFNTNSVFGAHNMKIVEAYRFLKKFNPDRMGFSFGPEIDDEKLSANYLEQMAQLAEVAYQEEGLEGLSKIREFYAPIKAVASQSITENHCGAGKTLLQADSRGDLYTCNWFMNDSEEKVGSGSEIFTEKLTTWQNPLTEIHGCETCWAKNTCGGGCAFVNKVKTGDKHEKDVEFCTRTRGLLALSITYYVKSLKNDLM